MLIEILFSFSWILSLAFMFMLGFGLGAASVTKHIKDGVSDTLEKLLGAFDAKEN